MSERIHPLIIVLGVLSIGLVTLAVVVSSGAESVSQPGNKTMALPIDAAITYHRSPGLSPCPSYQLQLSGDGRILFTIQTDVHDLEAVEPEPIEGQLTAEDSTSVETAFSRAGFSQLPDYIRSTLTDQAYSTITYTLGSSSKIVRHYHGDTTAPQKIKDLELVLETLVSDRAWDACPTTTGPLGSHL